MRNMFISKRPSGFYHLFYRDERTGKRKSVSTETKLKSEANKFLMNFVQMEKLRIQNKNYPIINIEILRDEFLKYAATNYKLSTTSIYLRVIKNLLIKFGNISINLITNKDIEEYKSFRLDTVSRTTVNIEINTLKALFNFAKRLNLINENPCNGIKKLRTGEREILEFSETEIKLILNNTKEKLMKDIIMLGLYTGCRLNEIINIQIGDIDLNERVIKIINKDNFETKTGRIREIPIPEALDIFDIINLSPTDHSSEDPELFEDPGPKNIIELYDPKKYIFCKGNGERFTKSYISRKFKRILRKCRLPEKFHFHCLRHTYATGLAKQGTGMHWVQKLMGHSNIKTTERYFHASMDDLRRAVSNIKY